MSKIEEELINIPYEKWREKLELKKKYISSKLITKLPYKKKNKNLDKWEIVFEKEDIIVDNEKKEINFPLNIDFKEFCYVLRVVIDGIFLIKNYCPMHASGLEYNNIQIILFAKTNNGKSYLINQLQKNFDKSKIIGDDHLIFDGKGIFGNSSIRTRGLDKDTYINIENIYSICKKRLVIGVNLSTDNKCEKIKNNEVIIKKLHELEFTKYLFNPFEIKGKRYFSDQIFRKKINDIYLQNILKFCKEIYFISGNMSYIEEKIVKIIESYEESK